MVFHPIHHILLMLLHYYDNVVVYHHGHLSIHLFLFTKTKRHAERTAHLKCEKRVCIKKKKKYVQKKTKYIFIEKYENTLPINKMINISRTRHFSEIWAFTRHIYVIRCIQIYYQFSFLFWSPGANLFEKLTYPKFRVIWTKYPYHKTVMHYQYIEHTMS